MKQKIKCGNCDKVVGEVEEGTGYLIDDPYCGLSIYCKECIEKDEYSDCYDDLGE